MIDLVRFLSSLGRLWIPERSLTVEKDYFLFHTLLTRSFTSKPIALNRITKLPLRHDVNMLRYL